MFLMKEMEAKSFVSFGALILLSQGDISKVISSKDNCTMCWISFHANQNFSSATVENIWY